ncbi:amidohydrolase family protein [Actinomadura montaniterrae]|uniref:Amidohydrolase n=1 Tax=Actinomadura montaniterrae TaxID=1803903 RepID=A0A6L3VNN2_9ACTN|nr:amidohydrolase family protein [Actinomadura montaniterrae]KAB2376063.1 amidohydrolase [Actinomadura montaniterrae]
MRAEDDRRTGGPSRRRVMTAAAVATAAAVTGAGTGAASARTGGAGPRNGRIDTHHHALPPDMKEWAVEHGLLPPEGGPDWGRWDLHKTLDTMDDLGIAAGVASAPAPSEAFRDRALAVSGPRVFNESLAGLVRDHPSRFGFFAYLPLLHVDIAIQEAAYALDELGADGVLLMANAGGRYLGDPAFDPLFAELDRRGAVAFVHPAGLADARPVPGVEDWIADFMLDTTRTALSLVSAGTLDRYKRLSVILAHAGGFLPYVGGRVEHAGRQGEGPSPAAFRRAVRRFHYDTAMPMSPYATPSLLAAAGAGRLLFGTDWPQVTRPEVDRMTALLDRDPSLDRRAHAAVNRENALRLFPALARRLRG